MDETPTKQEIITLLGNNQLGPTEIAARLDISRQMVHRHLRDLVDTGQVVRLGARPKNTYTAAGVLPRSVQHCVWDWDISHFDPAQHTNQLLFRIMNYGNDDAVAWMRSTYTWDDIARAIRTSIRSNWNNKSLALWSLLAEASPRASRFSS